MGGEGPPRSAKGEWREGLFERTRSFREWLRSGIGREDLLPQSSPHGRLGYRATNKRDGFSLHIIGFDSAWLCGDDHDAREILLTQAQIDALTTDEKGRPLNGFRLALVHHPLDDLKDAENSRNLLAQNVDLLLYGHRHETNLTEQSDPDRTMRMIAAGSLFEGDEGEHYVNRFHVIDIQLNDEGRPLTYDLEFWAWSPNRFWHLDNARYEAAPNGHLTWRTRLAPPQPLPRTFETEFIGRRREIDEYTDLVAKHRLVTLTGMGGIGKTRIAFEVVRRLSEERHEFTDRVVFVDIAHPTDNSSQAVVGAIAAALGDSVADTENEIVRALRERRTLLVLDNCETVTSGADVVARLLQACPDLHILATSQIRLGIDHEEAPQVEPMKTPEGSAPITTAGFEGLDSFQLFLERSRKARRKHNWTVSDDDASAVSAILGLTEGIPLAIELVAARMDQYTPAEIASRLKTRIDPLKREGPPNNERHRSIEACIEWTLNLLPTPAQELFPKLSVFAGGFFGDDADKICETIGTAGQLGWLMKYSLLSRTDLLRRSRYAMLETVREHARKKLARKEESRRLRMRHAQHFLNVLISADHKLSGKDHLSAVRRIESDEANIFVGIETSRQSGNHQSVIQYATSFSDYLMRRARFAENLALAQAARGAAQALNDQTLIAACDNNLSTAFGNLPTGDRGENLRRAIECCEAALHVYTEGDFPRDWAGTQNNLGAIFGNLPTGDRGENLKRAIGYYEAALRVYTEGHFPLQWAGTQNNLGNAYGDLPTGDRGENLERAIGYYEAALRVYNEGGFPPQWAGTQNNLGNAYGSLPTGDRGENLKRAIGYYEAALRVYTEEDFPQDWAMTQNNLGSVYGNLPTGDRAENLKLAIDCYVAGLRVYTERGFPQQWAATQNNLGNAYGKLPTGDRGENLKRALNCYEAALLVYTEDDFPQDWAMTQNNLGSAYGNLPTGDRGENLKHSIGCFEAALRVYTKDDCKQDWAMTKNNLNIAREELATLEDRE